jgi:hypothetical protein
MLFRVAQAMAILEGRDYCTPKDFKPLVVSVFAHRGAVSSLYTSTLKTIRARRASPARDRRERPGAGMRADLTPLARELEAVQFVPEFSSTVQCWPHLPPVMASLGEALGQGRLVVSID